MPPKGFHQGGSNIASFLALDNRRRDPSFNAQALDLASDLGDNRHGPDFGALGALPASFTTQLEMAARMRNRQGSEDEESNRVSRIMLARMTTLEEGFRDVLKEIKGFRKGSEDSRVNTENDRSPPNERVRRKGKGKRRGANLSNEQRMGSSV